MTRTLRPWELWKERKFHSARFVERFFPKGLRPGVARLFNLQRLTINVLENHGFFSLPIGPVTDALIRARFVEQDTIRNLSEGESVSSLKARIVDEAKISVSRRGGFAVKGDALLTRGTWTPAIPKLHFANSSVAGLVFQSGPTVYLARSAQSLKIEKGIFVGSFAPHNWFHWLIDTLPSVFFLRDLPEEYREYPLILPSGTLNKRSWSEALDLVNPGHLVVEVLPDVPHKVGTLVMVDGVSNGFPRPVELTYWNPRIAIRAHAMKEYREHLLTQVPSKARVENRFPDRVFIGRRDNNGRNYNQEELAELASQFGFKLVYLEDYSFLDSVALFQNAKFIIGPHGAGFANTLFVAPGTRILFWTWDDSRGDNWYENLFFITAADSEQIVISPGDGNPQHRDPRNSSYRIDTQQFRARLLSMLKK